MFLFVSCFVSFVVSWLLFAGVCSLLADVGCLLYVVRCHVRVATCVFVSWLLFAGCCLMCVGCCVCCLWRVACCELVVSLCDVCMC